MSYGTGYLVDDGNDNHPKIDVDNFNIPLQQFNFLYSVDSLGFRNNGFADEVAYRANFLEFVRVRFDGTAPSGNKTSGSRCSSKHPWTVRIWSIKNAAGTFDKKPGKKQYVKEGYQDIKPN